MKYLAPILLFVYSRLNHTKQAVEALKNNNLAKDSALIIYSDAASKPEHEGQVLDVRNYIQSIQGFKEVLIILQPNNKGLAKSIVDGVTEQINIHGKVIVMEDDLVSSPYFLTYMNEALSFYENESQVMHVSGFNFPFSRKMKSNFFLRFAPSWGWGTWKRAWNYLSLDVNAHIENISRRNLISDFNFEDSMGYFSHLEGNRDGSMNTWAVKWYASLFLQNGLCLFPSDSLIINIGHDGTGENCLENNMFSDQIIFQNLVNIHPIKIEESLAGRKKVSAFLKLMNGETTKWNGFKNKIRDKIKYELSKLKFKKS